MAVEERENTNNSGKQPTNDIAKTAAEVVDTDSGACEVAPPVPPDGGYGWVIMFASFICNVIVDGVCFSFGIFFLEFLQYFGESKSKTAWVGSVLNGMYLSMGPIVSALANRFGCRAVTIAGSIISCVAYVLATFSPNVNVLILTYGGLGGAGFGLIYLPAIVMVGYYFERKRAFATGVAVCGSGIGAFVFAPLTEFLISYYGWKGATLIVAGITLQGVVIGALFRPLEASCQPKNVEVPTEAKSVHAVVPNTVASVPDIYIDGESAGGIIQNGVAGIEVVHTRTLVNSGMTNGAVEPKDFLRIKMATTDKMAAATTIKPHETSKNSKSHIQSMHNLSPNNPVTVNPVLNRQLSMSVDHIFRNGVLHSDAELVQRARDIRRPLYRKDIFYSGSVMNLPEYKSNQNVSAVSYTQSVTSIPRGASLTGEPGGNVEKPGFIGICKSMTDTLGTMMDFSLMTNPVFAVYGMSCFLCMTGFFVPFMYLPDDAILKGVPRGQAAFLLSIIGIANTVARVLCGWVSDRPWANCLQINNCALIIGGISTIMAPFCTSYVMMVIYGAIFGSAIAVFVSLRSILMVELIGLDKLTNAFGLVTFCQGLSAFIGAPIAGALYDSTRDYHISFYFAGTTLLLAGLICLPLHRISRWQTRQEKARLSMLVSTEEANRMI